MASDTAIGEIKADLAAIRKNWPAGLPARKPLKRWCRNNRPFGGSADLTGSNNTKAADQDIYSAQNPAGHYIHYGCEHGTHHGGRHLPAGGAIPYGGTFLVFTDWPPPVYPPVR